MRIVPAAMCLAAMVAASAQPAEAASLMIPAWSFARGNAQIHTDPAQYADAGPVVASGPEKPWGWMVEYDIDIPVTGQYTLQI